MFAILWVLRMDSPKATADYFKPKPVATPLPAQRFDRNLWSLGHPLKPDLTGTKGGVLPTPALSKEFGGSVFDNPETRAGRADLLAMVRLHPILPWGRAAGL